MLNIIICDDDQFTLQMLSDLLDHAHERLGEAFIRCHRSVLVNRKHILSLQNGMIKLSNGELVICALSRRKMIQEICLRRDVDTND